MNLYECTLKSSGGGGGGGTGTGASLIVTCSNDFAGATISCSDGTNTFTGTCPSSSPYTVEFQSIPTGQWIVSGVADGETYSNTITISDFELPLLAYPTLHNVSYDTAYAAANALVSNGKVTYKGTYLDIRINDSAWDAYDTQNAVTPTLSYGDMGTRIWPTTPYTLHNDYTITRPTTRQTITFLKDGYIVYSYAGSDINNMTSMRAQGNVFHAYRVSANESINLATHFDPVEASFISFYAMN